MYIVEVTIKLVISQVYLIVPTEIVGMVVLRLRRNKIR